MCAGAWTLIGFSAAPRTAQWRSTISSNSTRRAWQEDVIYGRKFGVALTLDIIKPKENANGLGVISVISGGWFSSHDNINPGNYSVFLQRGYTVFAVVHGSQPKFTLPEILQDMN